MASERPDRPDPRLRADLLGAALVVLANPVLYSLPEGIHRYTLPDASAYGALARGLSSGFRLFLEGWIHVDQGLVLSPLFPALVALGSVFDDDLLRVGTHVSALAALGTGLAIYVLVSRLANRIVGLVTALAIQTGSTYFFYAFAPLTESLFILTNALTLVFLSRFLASGRPALGVGLGLCCALVFLSRKIGALVLGFCLLWICIDWVWRRQAGLGGLGRRLALVIASALLLLAPYAVLLYAQTGEHPLQDRFRMGRYTVTNDAPEVRAEIERVLARREAGDYRAIWRSRRQLRRLLPDASEQYGSLVPPAGRADPRLGVRRIATKAFRATTALPQRLLENANHLRREIGGPLFALFVLTSATPLLLLIFESVPPERFLVAGFVWTYLAGLSLATDMLARYSVVMIPFAMAHTSVELYALASRVRSPSWLTTMACSLLVATGAAAMPEHFDSVKLEKNYQQKLAPYAVLREHVRAGEAVFAASPLDAFLLGATYRALPNDTLEQVVRYARKTGVHWLVVADVKRNRREIRAYQHHWYLLPRREHERLAASLLEKRAEAGRGRYTLYWIRGS